MEIAFQDILAWVAIGCAIAYLIIRSVGRFRKLDKKGGSCNCSDGCGGCDGCNE